MTGSYSTFRILCSSPPDSQREQELFLSCLARFCEQVTMPDWVLFAPATFRAPFDANAARTAVEANIRTCDFFLHVYGGTVPDAVYQGFVDSALRCTADPDFAMRSAVVFFRETGEVSTEMRALRESLASDARCRVLAYHDESDLETHFRGMLEDWYSQVRRVA